VLETTITFETTEDDQDPYILDDPFEETDTDHPWPADTSSEARVRATNRS
jgi:hypothetical protein